LRRYLSALRFVRHDGWIGQGVGYVNPARAGKQLGAQMQWWCEFYKLSEAVLQQNCLNLNS
ncbi:MAG: hypothetical protein K0R82_2620, partial [Flavipsychrobacter sp.]|nr:hypothetical protein [Flavipsychrobacter sp.]